MGNLINYSKTIFLSVIGFSGIQLADFIPDTDTFADIIKLLTQFVVALATVIALFKKKKAIKHKKNKEEEKK